MKVLEQKAWNDSYVKQILDKHLWSEIPIAPRRRWVSIVVLREFHSTAVLTTEGQELDVEVVRSGQKNHELISRVVFQKRKQIAPERRTGRAFNRQMGWGEDCQYMNQMCGKCPDCLIYGYAATKGEGSQRARILTDSGFSIRSYDAIQRSITLNAIEDTTKGGVAGSAFAEREHIRPQVFFPTIETLVDVIPSEFVYVLRNLIATTRYGAESNRQGSVKNHIVAILFSDMEITSNLALTQGIYDRLYEQKQEQIHELPLNRAEVEEALLHVIKESAEQSYLPVTGYYGDELQVILESLRQLWKSEEGNQEWLQHLEQDHQGYLEKLEGSKKNSKKKK